MLNKVKKVKLDNKGFTIIEVMIVLAIAGLILLIVFLAVPQLQRSNRNTSRKGDAGHISSAINAFLSNNQGVQPATGSGTWGGSLPNDCNTILKDAGTLNQYTGTNNFDCPPTAGTGSGHLNTFDVDTGAPVALNPLSGQAMVLYEGTTCPTTISPTAKPVPGNNNQDSLLYTTEPASGLWNWTCIQVE